MPFNISFKYIVTVLIAVSFTWLLHEFFHWFVSESLGYDSLFRINSVSYMNPQDVSDWHKIIVSASGPLITIVQALICFKLLYNRKWNMFIYPFLFVPFYMRTIAGIMNIINPNDEGRISIFLNLGLYTLPLIVSLLLFYFIYKTAKKHNLTRKFHIITVLSVMVFSSMLILADQFYNIQIIP